jgi:predicted DNA-binding transcriptional regulator AlpA
LFSILIYFYLTMKKPTTPNEKPAPKAKTEQPVAAVATEAKTKKPNPTQKTPNKPQAVTLKPAPKAKTEQPVAAVATETKPNKPSPVPKSPKKAKDVELKPEESTTEIPMPERVGLTAGNIWHYLSENGANPVAKLVRELPEEEKIIQRSIGWLAQEGKITLDTIDRIETISLKD